MRYLYIFSMLSISYTLSAGYEDEVYKFQDQLQIGTTIASRQKLIQEAEEQLKASIILEVRTSNQTLQKKCADQQLFLKAYIQILTDLKNSRELNEATEKQFINLGKLILFNQGEIHSLINQQKNIFKQTSSLHSHPIKVEKDDGGNNPLPLPNSAQNTLLLPADTKNPYIDWKKKRPQSEYLNSPAHSLPQPPSILKISNTNQQTETVLPRPKQQIKWHYVGINFIDNQSSFQVEPRNKKRKFSEISQSQSSYNQSAKDHFKPAPRHRVVKYLLNLGANKDEIRKALKKDENYFSKTYKGALKIEKADQADLKNCFNQYVKFSLEKEALLDLEKKYMEIGRN